MHTDTISRLSFAEFLVGLVLRQNPPAYSPYGEGVREGLRRAHFYAQNDLKAAQVPRQAVSDKFNAMIRDIDLAGTHSNERLYNEGIRDGLKRAVWAVHDFPR